MPQNNTQDNRDRQAARRAAYLRRRRAHRRAVASMLLCLVLAVVAVVLAVRTLRPVHGAVVEAGQGVTPAMFVRSVGADTSFGPNNPAIDTSVPGEYDIQIFHNGKLHDVTLKVRDTTPPAAEGKTVVAPFGELPAAADCVENVQDVSAVTAQWKKEPDMEKVDEPQSAVVRLTDAQGNRADVPVQVTVRYDAVPPVITGAKDIKAFLGDSIAYRDGVTVTDDTDAAPELSIDSSQVNINAEGVYTATYTAADQSGNTTSVSVNVSITEKPSDYVEEEEAYQVAQEYYDQLIDEDMTDFEKAYAIYHWVKDYIYYVDHSEHEYWTVGAKQAFTELAGDCFIYYSAAKCLLNMAGIKNYDVVKSDTSRSSHFWLLVDLGYGWYHFDACPRVGDTPDHTFMLTDEEMQTYSQLHDNSNVFDPTLYPERATQSVQQWVHYESNTVSEPKLAGANG